MFGGFSEFLKAKKKKVFFFETPPLEKVTRDKIAIFKYIDIKKSFVLESLRFFWELKFNIRDQDGDKNREANFSRVTAA